MLGILIIGALIKCRQVCYMVIFLDSIDTYGKDYSNPDPFLLNNQGNTDLKTEGQSFVPSTPRRRLAFGEPVQPVQSFAVPAPKLTKKAVKKKQTIDEANEELSKYRDRAVERRVYKHVEDGKEEEVMGLDIDMYLKRKQEIEQEKRSVVHPKPMQHVEDIEVDAPTNIAQEEKPLSWFKMDVARRVYQYLFEPEKSHNVESFLPGRSIYVYNMDENNKTNLPTLIERSKEEVEHLYQPRMVAAVSKEIVEAVKEVTDYFKTGGVPKKRKQEEEPLPEESVSPKALKVVEPVDDDEDIFDDV